MRFRRCQPLLAAGLLACAGASPPASSAAVSPEGHALSAAERCAPLGDILVPVDGRLREAATSDDTIAAAASVHRPAVAPLLAPGETCGRLRLVAPGGPPAHLEVIVAPHAGAFDWQVALVGTKAGPEE